MTSIGTAAPFLKASLLGHTSVPCLHTTAAGVAVGLLDAEKLPLVSVKRRFNACRDSAAECSEVARMSKGSGACVSAGAGACTSYKFVNNRENWRLQGERQWCIGLDGGVKGGGRLAWKEGSFRGGDLSGRWKELAARHSRRYEVRTPRASGDGNGEKGSGKTTTTATEEPEKDPKPTPSSPSSPSSPAPAENAHQSIPVNVQLDAFRLMELIGPEKVDPEDVKVLKEKLFGYTTFWVTGQEPFGDLGEGVLLLGNLRGKREEVFAKLQRGLQDLLGRKYNMFMVEEPNAEEEDPRGGPRVSFVLLRKEVSDPGPTTLWQYVIAAVLCVLTAGSCLELGIATQLSRLPPDVVRYFTNPESMDPPDLQVLVPFIDSALPLAYGVFGVQLFHEVGHWLAAAPRKVKIGIPYLIPNITLGSFGAVTQFKSICPDRTAKFDISVAGPLAGAVLSFSMLAVGLWLSVSPEAGDELVKVPSLLFQGSLLLGLTSRAVLGYNAMHAATVAIHPLVVAGWCGLTTTAFNLMPVGCLDGGRAMQAAFGKTVLNISGLLTYLLLGIGALGGPLSLPWGLYILIVQRAPEKPALNDVAEVGSLRKAGLSIALVFVLAMLLPLWDGLAEELGIGLGTPLF